MHPTNRGVGLLGDKVYFASADAVLVALDARSGKELWTAKVADYKSGYYMSLMPLVADGKVMLGTSGGEFGVRGFVAAYDAESGKEAWRTYMVPEPGQPGSETWPAGDQWKTGGASIWVPGAGAHASAPALHPGSAPSTPPRVTGCSAKPFCSCRRS